MINRISFTGRETMLTDKLVKPVEQKVVRASTYIQKNVSPKAEPKIVKPVENFYSSPFMPIAVPEAVRPATLGANLHFFG